VSCHHSFEADVTGWLRSNDVRWRAVPVAAAPSGRLLILRNPETRAVLALHLLCTPTAASEVLPADATSALSDLLAAQPRARRLIHLWEDQWQERPEIVRSRLLASLGRTRREFARRTHAERIDAATLDAFLAENHLWGPTKARFRYGLYTGPKRSPRVGTSGSKGGAGVRGAGDKAEEAGELIAVASFSPRRHMPRTDGGRSRSHEMIRYCSRQGESVVGGISKLMAAFARDAEPDDIVTVVDRDWSTADGWRGLGFVSVQRMEPVAFFVGQDGLRCHIGGGPNPHRRRLPPQVTEEFERHWEAGQAGQCAARRHEAGGDGGSVDGEPRCESEKQLAMTEFLAERRYFPVHDAGAERLLLELRPPSA